MKMNKEKVNIVCLLWKGNFRKRDYCNMDVRKLKQSVKKWIDRPFEFHCLTNDMKADIPANKISLERNYPGWWSKIELFRPDLPVGRTLYLDLDSQIVNSLQPILDYPGNLVMFDTRTVAEKLNKQSYYRRKEGIVWKYQAATMLFDPGALSWVYDRFCKNSVKWMNTYRSEQDIYADWLPNQPVFPKEWMVKLQTLKKKKLSKSTIIVTGQPKNQDFRNPKFAPWLNKLARTKE